MKKIVKNRFKKAVSTYDRANDIQSVVHAFLMNQLPQKKWTSLLDLGCASGRLTHLLQQETKASQVIGIDSCEAMIKEAQQLSSDTLSFQCQDIQQLDLDGSFDGIVSNATFQWVENFNHILSQCKKYALPGATFAFSVFYPGTFNELEDSLSVYYKKKVTLAASSFRSESHYVECLEKHHMNLVAVKSKKIIKTYTALTELLKSIKQTGTGTTLLGHEGLWTPKKLSDLEDIYLKRSPHATATYHVGLFVATFN